MASGNVLDSQIENDLDTTARKIIFLPKRQLRYFEASGYTLRTFRFHSKLSVNKQQTASLSRGIFQLKVLTRQSRKVTNFSQVP